VKASFKDVNFNGKTIVGDNATLYDGMKELPVLDSARRARPEPSRILFFSANPMNTDRLRIDEEARVIQEALRGNDRFVFETRWAVRREDLVNLLISARPEYVHFSGHGLSGGGIVLEDHDGSSSLVPAAALRNLFSLLAPRTRCVILNSCYSVEQARAVAEHIELVIGTSDSISDSAALAFSRSFYGALASGQTVPQAFAAGRVQVQIECPGSESLLCLLQKGALRGESEGES
jgi:hypothetical protein